MRNIFKNKLYKYLKRVMYTSIHTLYIYILFSTTIFFYKVIKTTMKEKINIIFIYSNFLTRITC